MSTQNITKTKEYKTREAIEDAKRVKEAEKEAKKASKKN